jgi:hypothetical protein
MFGGRLGVDLIGVRTDEQFLTGNTDELAGVLAAD